MIIKTYEIQDGQRILQVEEHLNQNDMLTSTIEYHTGSKEEVLLTYNDHDLLKSETQILDGQESSRVEYEYDAKKRLVGRTLFFGEDAYETTRLIHDEKSSRSETHRDDELVSEETELYDPYFNERKDYYDGEVISRTVTKYNEQEGVMEIGHWGEEERFLQGSRLYQDDQGNVMRSLALNEHEQIISDYSADFTDGIIQKSVTRDLLQPGSEFVGTFEYDDAGNLTKEEVRDQNGELVDIRELVYDDQNRLIEEKGLSRGHLSQTAAFIMDGMGFHFIVEYEE